MVILYSLSPAFARQNFIFPSQLISYNTAKTPPTTAKSPPKVSFSAPPALALSPAPVLVGKIVPVRVGEMLTSVVGISVKSRGAGMLTKDALAVVKSTGAGRMLDKKVLTEVQDASFSAFFRTVSVTVIVLDTGSVRCSLVFEATIGRKSASTAAPEALGRTPGLL